MKKCFFTLQKNNIKIVEILKSTDFSPTNSQLSINVAVIEHSKRLQNIRDFKEKENVVRKVKISRKIFKNISENCEK